MDTEKDRSPVVAWMSGASLVTFTTSVAPPTSSVSRPIATREPGGTATPVRLSVRNDGISTRTVYVSAVMFGTTKSPVALVTTGAILVPWDSLTSVTVAPGTTPPCTSWTVPGDRAGDALAKGRRGHERNDEQGRAPRDPGALRVLRYRHASMCPHLVLLHWLATVRRHHPPSAYVTRSRPER